MPVLSPLGNSPVALVTGVAGGLPFVQGNAEAAGGIHPQGQDAAFGASIGQEIGDATWMGSQDYCRDNTFDPDDRDGLGGIGDGTSQNDMNPFSINCHQNPGGPGNGNVQQCGGDCDSIETADGPSGALAKGS